MEDWRVKALELVPELRAKILENNLNPMRLWIELYGELVLAYQTTPVNDDLIGRIYDFADWCFGQPQGDSAWDDISSAAAVGFVEDLPLDKNVAADLYRWLSLESFDGFENLFKYLLSEDEFLRLREDFVRKKKDYHGPTRL